MARYPYQGFIQDGNGRAIESVTVTVYLADTTTTATIYAAKSGGSAITGGYVTTSESGYFIFYVDDTDYATLQLFDLVPTKSGYSFDTIEDVVVNGVSYQPLDADLTAIAALAKTDGNIIVGDGSTWVAESGATARTSLGLAIGTNVQAYSADLDVLDGLAANKFPARSSAGATAEKTITDFAFTLLDDSTAAAARTTLALAATAAEIKTGTETNKYPAPDQLLSAITFSGCYTSDLQTITAGGALTIAHGLGRAPVLVQTFIKCIDAGGEEGYAQNDIVAISLNADPAAATSRGTSIVCDATNINVRYGSNANTYAWFNKGTGTVAVLTNSKWNLIVRVWA